MATRILVPLDGSQLAMRSLPLALKLAYLTGGELLLLRVVGAAEESHYKYLNQMETEAEHYLNTVKRVLTFYLRDNHLPHLSVQTLVVGGHPAQIIAEQAHKHQATLILMTTHGRGRLAQLVMGSTALEVIQHTDLPVILFRPAGPAEEEKVEFYIYTLAHAVSLSGPLVVTLDGSAEAELALEPALDLASQTRRPLHLLRVVRPFVGVDEMAPWYEANLALGPDTLHQQEFPHLQEQATVYLEKLQASLKERHQGCQIAVRVGDPAYEILKYAKQVKASLLAMATHPHSRVGHALLGNIADRVICQSDIPVMLVNLNLNLKRKGANLS